MQKKLLPENAVLNIRTLNIETYQWSKIRTDHEYRRKIRRARLLAASAHAGDRATMAAFQFLTCTDRTDR